MQKSWNIQTSICLKPQPQSKKGFYNKSINSNCYKGIFGHEIILTVGTDARVSK